MIGFGMLAKLANGGLDPEAAIELLSSFGCQVDAKEVAISEAPFTRLAETASLPRAEMVEFRGTMKGKSFHVLLVTTPCDSGHKASVENRAIKLTTN